MFIGSAAKGALQVTSGIVSRHVRLPGVTAAYSSLTLNTVSPSLSRELSRRRTL